jgi:hypothetical protein
VEQNYVLTSTKWTDADGKEVTTFQKGVDYTVTITLTAKEGYKFTSPTSIPNVIVGDEKLSVSTSVRDSVTGQTSEMTVLYTFQADGTGTNTGGNSQGTGGDQIDEEETIPAPSITYISPTAGKSPKKASVTNDISPAPYDVKTTWTTTKDGKALDSTDTFKEDTEYTVTTVFTAHDGYIFTADSVNKEYITVGNLAGIKTDAKLSVTIPDGGKTMTVSVSYGETSELTCTCKISDIQLADQTITLEANESVRTLQIRPSTKISSSCPVEGHPKEVSWNYAVKEGEDVISISDQGLITTKKEGEAVITITATLPRRDDEEPAVSSADVKITVKSKRAKEADVTNLENAVADAKEKINGVKEDLYTADSVETLKAAIAEAEELLAKKPVISAEDVQAALEKIERAKLVEKGSETPGTDTTPGKDETPGTDATPGKDETPSTDATPGKDETPSTDATPGKNDTPTTNLTPDKDNTSGTGDPSNKAGGTGSKTPQAEKVVAGQTYDSGDYYYKVISTADKTVQVSGLKNVDLKKITIYSSVVIGGESYKVIGVTANAFKNNKKITAVTIKKNAVSIGSSAFAGCTSLKKVTVKGSTLKTIGAKAFSGCKNLKAISLKPDKALKSVGKNAFKGISKKAVIKVPAAKRAAYKKLLAKKGQAGSVKIK